MGSVTEGVASFFKDLLNFEMGKSEYDYNPSIRDQKSDSDIERSDFISRDLSWLKFNERVLDQVRNPDLNIFQKFKFLAITGSNLDEFLTVRVGSLYNYLDFGKPRLDYSGLRETAFRKVLLNHIKKFSDERNRLFREELKPLFEANEFKIVEYSELRKDHRQLVNEFFDQMVYPMLTPMVYDHTHTFPILLPKNLILGVVSVDHNVNPDSDDNRKLSFVQIPSNLPKFFEIEDEGMVLFLPIEDVVKHNLTKVYKNVKIESVDLFRIIRNGDFEFEDDELDEDFVNEMKEKIRGRQAGRVVFMVIESSPSTYMMDILKKKWDIDKYNIQINNDLMDYTRLMQIVNHEDFRSYLPKSPSTIPPTNYNKDISIFENIKEHDILLHHPYNSFEPVLHLIERAAEDPNVLSIKLTIYRLAKNSRITAALLRAAENGKHVSALFEIKARFDEENNIREAEKLRKAGCFVIYGIGWLKTHTKLMLIVRKEGSRVVQYAHMSSGNYNEDTSRYYTDVSLLTANEAYTHDIAEFFNAITGHSQPKSYNHLITSPKDMRNAILRMIQREIDNHKKGKTAGICLKINSLEDKDVIEALYAASQAGVKVNLIIRGICCLRPGRAGLSENIKVRSIVGNYLEHARILYFHNAGEPEVFVGSADLMVRSFDKRIESLFQVTNEQLSAQLTHILKANLEDNYNAYELLENGEYVKVETKDLPTLNVHQYFYERDQQNLLTDKLF
ncbi:Polyphosphate kinase [Leadbetterella byssophila DSM 17132]|uniref:Polyphosphate kinase n=1 Tax=Leadbetterella byssophila (strain DSM 17132 / JCM 16389 / KACC 11308 / NBRC 106382 / 4M15) TaxID=649349 RepID=E4RQE5_LEAB4|nr:polyphosphate kinase 1 [Leadbetterella byssophila]ADQ18353.1 Polyphosphate kinase [Leadbetterella byssophila DSM 17132]